MFHSIDGSEMLSIPYIWSAKVRAFDDRVSDDTYIYIYIYIIHIYIYIYTQLNQGHILVSEIRTYALSSKTATCVAPNNYMLLTCKSSLRDAAVGPTPLGPGRARRPEKRKETACRPAGQYLGSGKRYEAEQLAREKETNSLVCTLFETGACCWVLSLRNAGKQPVGRPGSTWGAARLVFLFLVVHFVVYVH